MPLSDLTTVLLAAVLAISLLSLAGIVIIVGPAEVEQIARKTAKRRRKQLAYHFGTHRAYNGRHWQPV